MDEKRFENGFGENSGAEEGFNPVDSAPEPNPFFYTRTEINTPEENAAASVEQPYQPTQQYSPAEPVVPERVGDDYRFGDSYRQPVFRENVKKEKKPMSVNAKIAVASVISSIAGCLLTVLLIAALLLTNTVRFPSSVTKKTGNSKIYVSEAPAAEVKDGEGVSVPDIIDAVGPAVVGINCQTEYTDWFWGSSVQPSSGSGVIINEDGFVVTNNHVIEGADEVTITLISGETYETELVGRDARTDLAVIKVKDLDKKLPYAVIGDSSGLRVGDTVIAIGNPLGEEFAGSATKGIVSATNRTVDISEKTLTVIQTDAAINPGNSGGALVNMNGEVIGINTAKIADSSIEGLGFSIPSNEFLPVIEDIMENGHVTGRPLIGITGRAITEELSEQYGYPIGVYVVEVAPFSGAEDAGIKSKDVITEVEGEKVESVEDINVIRDKFKAGDKVKMKIYRKTTDKTLDVEITLGEDKGETY